MRFIRFAGLLLAFAPALSSSRAAPVPLGLGSPLRTSLPHHEARIEEHLLRLVYAARGERPEFVDGAEDLVRRDSLGRAFVTITSSDVPASVEALQQEGVALTFADSRYGFVEAWLPLDRLEAFALHSATRRIDPTFPGWVAVCPAQAYLGTVAAEADCILKARDARDAVDVDGTGVTVGVISDGVASMVTSVGTGDLPPGITILNSGPATAAEGRAMMEIVHDVAPGARMAFSSAVGGAGQFIASAQALVAAGCSVIVDDVGLHAEPVFEDGQVARAVGDMVASGVTWISAAGNSADSHYAADYQDGGRVTINPTSVGTTTIAHAHVFSTDGSGGNVCYYPFILAANSYAFVYLQWSDPWTSPEDDYDLYVVGKRDGVRTKVWESANRQFLPYTHPAEWVKVSNETGVSAEYRVYVDQYSGSAQRLQIYLQGPVSTIAPVAEGSLSGHAAVPGVLAVGAISAAAAPYDTMEPYSSRGPVDIRFPAAAQRAKPDVAGIDHVATTVPGFSPFDGTSAAAPGVAGVAALLKEMSPAMTVAQIRSAIRSTCVDVGPAGPDFASGVGRVDALAAVEYLKPTVTLNPATVLYAASAGASLRGPTAIVLTASNPSRGSSVSWTLQADVPWLHFDRTSGTLRGTDSFRVWADSTGMAAPGATGHITVLLHNANLDVLTIDVQMVVSATPNVFVVTGTVRDADQPNVTTFGDAVSYANSHPGTTILFAIPATDKNFTAGVAHMAESGWRQFSQSGTIVDGASETAYVHDTNPNGPEIEFSNFEFYVTAGSCVINNIAVGNAPPSADPNYANAAISFEGSGAVNNRVYGCYIGLDATGMIAVPNQIGIGARYGSVLIGGSSPAERNLIAGNNNNIQFENASNNVVTGNWIGLNAAGARVGGSKRGVLIGFNSSNNIIGGALPGEGNVISGHDFDAISIQTASTGNRVVGNLLGTDPAGTSAIPNAVTGVGISNSANNEVGGVSPGERNVISGNDTAGIRISGSTASGNRVIGNLIGVKANGVDALPNGTNPSSLIGGADSAGGILFDNGAHDNVIGGLLWETGKRNIIAGNALAGVRFKGASAHNFVLGNSIGVTDAEGNAPVANQGPGILLLGASARNVIGGLDPFDGTFASGANDIGHNTGAGVAMAADSSHTNTVSDNAIHDNGGLGLDLGNDGRPAGPADGFYNAPFLTTAYRYAGFTLLSGTFDPGTDAAQLEIYTSPSADPSGYGEGRRHLITIATNAAGAFAYALPALDPGTVLTMLAIRRQASGLTDPSEFSNAVTVQDPPAAIDHAPIVTMIQPNGGETLEAGSIYEIQWTMDFIGGLNPQRIEFSTDSGATWEDLAIELDPAVRSWQWTVPRLRTETARVRVTVSDWAGRSGSAISAADFMIHTLLPWTLGDAAEALRIAAGLQAALLTDVSRLDLETGSGSLGRIDVRDAVRIARKAAGLDP